MIALVFFWFHWRILSFISNSAREEGRGKVEYGYFIGERGERGERSWHRDHAAGADEASGTNVMRCNASLGREILLLLYATLCYSMYFIYAHLSNHPAIRLYDT